MQIELVLYYVVIFIFNILFIHLAYFVLCFYMIYGILFIQVLS